MDRYSEIFGQGHLERKSSLQIFNEYQGPLDSHKGSREGFVSSFIFQDHEAMLGAFHGWMAHNNYHEMII